MSDPETSSPIASPLSEQSERSENKPVKSNDYYFVFGFLLAVVMVLIALLVWTNKEKPVPPAPPHQLNVVSFFGCQYLAFENPFFIVHAGHCTNYAGHGTVPAWQ